MLAAYNTETPRKSFSDKQMDDKSYASSDKPEENAAKSLTALQHAS